MKNLTINPGHFIMTLAVMCLMSIIAFLSGHATGADVVQVIVASAGTVVLTVFFSTVFPS